MKKEDSLSYAEAIAEIDKTIKLLKHAKAELKQKLHEEKIMGDLIDRKDLKSLMKESPDFAKYLKIVNNITNITDYTNMKDGI